MKMDEKFMKLYANLKKPLDCFDSLHHKNNEMFKMMKTFGSNICPLAVVGMFMNHAGIAMLNDRTHNILRHKTAKARKVFFPHHEVLSITLMDNGDVLTTALIIEPSNLESNEKKLVQFRSKAIVLSNGAHQILHPLFYKQWFPFLKQPQNKDKVVLSDQFLKRDNYKKIMKRISENNLQKIVIIGGSHSGYSCAWLMLNGPSDYNKHNFLKCENWK